MSLHIAAGTMRAKNQATNTEDWMGILTYQAKIDYIFTLNRLHIHTIYCCWIMMPIVESLKKQYKVYHRQLLPSALAKIFLNYEVVQKFNSQNLKEKNSSGLWLWGQHREKIEQRKVSATQGWRKVELELLLPKASESTIMGSSSSELQASALSLLLVLPLLYISYHLTTKKKKPTTHGLTAHPLLGHLWRSTGTATPSLTCPRTSSSPAWT